jgi:hypothetical protein
LERLEVLPRLAFAYDIAGQCEKCKEVLDTCVQLSKRNSTTNSRHNDYELLLLNARYRSGVDHLTLPAEASECVQDTNASPAHRVEAAILALKLAADSGDMDVFARVYEIVLPLLLDGSVPERSKCELQIIYQSTLGDGLVPIEDLHHFARAALAADGELGYSRALTISAVACRVSGRYKAGLEFTSMALEHARSHRLASRCNDIKLAEVQLHIAAGEFETANRVLQDARTGLGQSDNVRVQNEIKCNDALLAIQAGDFDRALAAFRTVDKESLPLYSITRKGFYLALELNLLLQSGAGTSVITTILEELEQTHLKMRRVGFQDFELQSLYLGMCEHGQRARAQQLLKEYFHMYRKAKWPIPNELARALSAE